MERTAGAAISVRGLVKAFDVGRGRKRRTVDAVRGVTFDVAPGERIAYIGPNREGAIVQQPGGARGPLS